MVTSGDVTADEESVKIWIPNEFYYIGALLDFFHKHLNHRAMRTVHSGEGVRRSETALSRRAAVQRGWWHHQYISVQEGDAHQSVSFLHFLPPDGTQGGSGENFDD